MDLVSFILQKIANAITTSWAFWLAIIGIFFGICAYLFGDHDHKGKSAKVVIGSVLMLGINQFLLWLHP